MTDGAASVYDLLEISPPAEACAGAAAQPRRLLRAMLVSVGIPLGLQLALAGYLFYDGARHSGSWAGVIGVLFLLLGVAPTTVVNLVITAFRHRQPPWLLALRGVAIGIAVPVFAAWILSRH